MPILGTGPAIHVPAAGGGTASGAVVWQNANNISTPLGRTYYVPQFNTVLSDPHGMVIAADGTGQASAGTKIIKIPTTGLWRLAWSITFHDPTISTTFTDPTTAAGSPFHLMEAGVQSDQGSTDPASWWNQQLCAIFGGPTSSGTAGYASNDSGMTGSVDVPLEAGDTVEPFLLFQFATASGMYLKGGSFFSAVGLS